MCFSESDVRKLRKKFNSADTLNKGHISNRQFFENFLGIENKALGSSLLLLLLFFVVFLLFGYVQRSK